MLGTTPEVIFKFHQPGLWNLFCRFLSDVNPAVSQFLLITLFSVSESLLLEIYLYIFCFLHAREPPQRLNSIRADEQSASEFKTEAL